MKNERIWDYLLVGISRLSVVLLWCRAAMFCIIVQHGAAYRKLA
jgi:hypothetical protein